MQIFWLKGSHSYKEEGFAFFRHTILGMSEEIYIILV